MSITDRTKKFLVDAGFPQPLPEALFYYLEDQGYTAATLPEKLREYAVDNGYENINQLISVEGSVLGGGAPKPIQVDGTLNVVLLGASIMNAISNTDDKRRDFERLFAENGIVATVYDRATGGHDSGDTLDGLAAILSEFSGVESRTLFVLHTGGNNISASGPYPGGYTSLNADFRDIIEAILASGAFVVPSTITYRVPPASNPSAPYNDGIAIPIISDLLIEQMINGRPVLDLYNFTFDSQATWHSGDGIHPTTAGEAATREYIAQQVSSLVSQTGVPAASDYIHDAVIRFGKGSAGFMSGNNSVVAADTPLTTIYESDGATLVVADCSIIASNFDGTNTTGRGNTSDPSDTSISLTNNALLSAFIYSDNPTPTTISILGVDPFALYTVSITASRDAAAPRIGDFTVGGSTQGLDAADDPPSIITFSDVYGYDLLANGISMQVRAGSLFCYLSGIRITKQ